MSKNKTNKNILVVDAKYFTYLIEQHWYIASTKQEGGQAMQKMAAIIFGILVLGLGAVGLLAGDEQLFGFMNVDLALDVGRLALAALLLYAVYGAKDRGLIRTSLLVFAVVYVGLAVVGLLDREVFGLLPNELSMFDLIFHAATGLVALMVAMGESEEKIDPTT